MPVSRGVCVFASPLLLGLCDLWGASPPTPRTSLRSKIYGHWSAVNVFTLRAKRGQGGLGGCPPKKMMSCERSSMIGLRGILDVQGLSPRANQHPSGRNKAPPIPGPAKLQAVLLATPARQNLAPPLRIPVARLSPHPDPSADAIAMLARKGRNGPPLLALTLALAVVLFAAVAEASKGDWLPEFIECVEASRSPIGALLVWEGIGLTVVWC